MTVKELNNHNLVPTEAQLKNLEKLSFVMTQVEELCGKKFTITSGLRSVELQLKINPQVKNSAHLTGEAVDCLDLDHSIWNFCYDNLKKVADLGIYIEDKSGTARWIHFQIRPTRSGNIVFIP